MHPRGKQCGRINQISQADIFQRRPDGPVYLVPVIAHKTAIADSTGILRTINTAIHRYRTFHSLNDVNKQDGLRGGQKPIPAGRAAPRFQQTLCMKKLGHLGHSRLV
jgi:hypothetical protein